MIALFQEEGQTVEVAGIDDARIIGTLSGVVAILCLYLLYDCLYERLLDLLVYEKRIGGNASLAGIEQLAPYNALRGNTQVGIGIDNTRAFAAQFEGNGCEVTCGSLHHTMAVGLAAGIEDIVPRERQQSVGNLHVGLYGCYIFIYKTFVYQTLQTSGRMGGLSRRLYHNAVAGSYCADKGQ